MPQTEGTGSAALLVALCSLLLGSVGLLFSNHVTLFFGPSQFVSSYLPPKTWSFSEEFAQSLNFYFSLLVDGIALLFVMFAVSFFIGWRQRVSGELRP